MFPVLYLVGFNFVKMIMRGYKFVFFLIVVSLSGCFDFNNKQKSFMDDEKFKAWRLGVAISHNFPALVEQAYGVNYTEDWTSIMLPYGQLFNPRRYSLESMRKRSYPDYSGNELLLHPIVNLEQAQMGPRYKALPDELYIYWQVANSRVNYATVVKITEEIKLAMTRPYVDQDVGFEGQRCYQTRFLFGLLPDGRAKLWLRGCGIYTYIGTYQPAKSVPEDSGKKAENKPVPWDKVNKVWFDRKYDKMQTLADVIKELGQEINASDQ
ncbi:DUF2931 family protein [Vibrio fluminensis]|uniref:DUF2931 family protein n=1 Tax=Vibrio fluminensis TaxID=2783614 RepID=UPI001888463F|nr:DUF2931 family protein [Vibrio fluminensis]